MIDEAWPFWQVEDGNQVAVIRRSSTSSDCPFGLRQITLTVGINPAQLGEGLLAAIAMPLEGRPGGQPSMPEVHAFTERREGFSPKAQQGLGMNVQSSGHLVGAEPLLGTERHWGNSEGPGRIPGEDVVSEKPCWIRLALGHREPRRRASSPSRSAPHGPRSCRPIPCGPSACATGASACCAVG